MAYGNPSAAPSAPDSEPFADAEMPQKEAAPQEEEHGNEEGVTAMLPKSILAGKEFKPGEEVVLKIVSMQGDQVEVAYSYGEEGGGGGGEYGKGGGDTEMSQMME